MQISRRSIRRVTLVLSVLVSLLATPTSAPPVNHVTAGNIRFPEQEKIPPDLLRDGQPWGDKAFIMKMIDVLERKTTAEHGRLRPFLFSQDYIFEGDVILEKTQALNLILKTPAGSRRKRKADVNSLRPTSDPRSKRWNLPINYVFDDTFPLESQSYVKAGISDWEENTCIRFTNDVNTTAKSLLFIDDTVCYSYVGNSKHTKRQIISVGNTCTRKGIVAHEIGHALGFWHEHARKDRDEHVKILRENIEMGKQHDFEEIPWSVINNLAVPYDMGSVMHYSGKTFAKRNLASIQSLDPLLQNTIGQRHALSFYDAKLANLAYCNDTCNGIQLNGTCLNDGYQDPKNCSRCRCPDGLSGDFCDKVAPSKGECGGTVHLSEGSTTSITSPGYPVFFTKDLRCYWLIHSPNGTAIQMEFQEPFMHSEQCDYTYPYKQCEDFVEVRTADNLAVTGGRFCCDDRIQRPVLSKPIITNSSHAIVLFETYVGGYVGFKLKLSVVSCGGCSSHTQATQKPCAKKVIRDCNQTWYVETKESGCAMPEYGCSTRTKIKEVHRKTKCYIEEPNCCSGYTLSPNKTLCIKVNPPPSPTTVTYNSSDEALYNISSNLPNGNISQATSITTTSSSSSSSSSSMSPLSSTTTDRKTANSTTTTNILTNVTTSVPGETSSTVSSRTQSVALETSTTSTTSTASAASPQPVVTDITTSSSSSVNTTYEDGSSESDQGEPITWSKWSEWGDCSVSCGGCGSQSRSRSCLSGHTCVDEAMQTKECGNPSCGTGTEKKSCAVVTTESYPCGLFGSSTCYRQRKIYRAQTFYCCCGYSEEGNNCTKTED